MQAGRGGDRLAERLAAERGEVRALRVDVGEGREAVQAGRELVAQQAAQPGVPARPALGGGDVEHAQAGGDEIAAQLGQPHQAGLLEVRLAGEVVAEAVAQRAVGQPAAVAAQAGAEVAPHDAGAEAALREPRPQQRAREVEGRHDDVLAAVDVAHDQRDVALAVQRGQVGDGERAGRNAAPRLLHVVDVDVDGRLRLGDAAGAQRREDHQAGVDVEVGLALDAGERGRRAELPAAAHRVADAQRAQPLQVVALVGGRDARPGRRVAGLAELGEAVDHHRPARQPGVAQAEQVRGAGAAAGVLRVEVVVEVGAAVEHRPRRRARPRAGSWSARRARPGPAARASACALAG